jgi:lysophospholipase
VTASFRAENLMSPDRRFLRAGIWDLPAGAHPRAICVLLPGLTEFLEKYEEVAGELQARGFLPVGLDWRSQGASERRGRGNRAVHVTSFEEYDYDLAILMKTVVEPIQLEQTTPSGDRLPVIALSHSMGGQLLLRYLREHPRRFTMAVAVAPLLEINTGEYSQGMAEIVTMAMNLRRPSTRFVFGVEDHDPMELSFEANRVTSDPARHARNRDLLKAQPFLRVYGPTFGWLRAAFAAMRRTRKPEFAKSIQTPLLMFGAGKDHVVRTAPIRDFAARLPHGRYVEIADSQHEILMETDAIRAQFWTAFDEFTDAELARVAVSAA